MLRDRRCSLLGLPLNHQSADETWMPLHRRKIWNRDSRPMMTGDAEIAFEGLEHLDLAAEHGALDQMQGMHAEAIALLAKSTISSDLGAADFALADLGARPACGLGLAGAQNQLGRRRRRERRCLLVAVNRPKLGDRLKAEHRAKPALASSDHQRLELALALKNGQFVGDDPDWPAPLLFRHQPPHD